ncbi:hypothetical protein VP01_237g8 [Puccinia sorghi]|uniref:Uncharacterized protein n=1 Tax=Puccinia sorghi TaxID=27349 RepID=A0A0L6V6W5_9BASI|nr:hypothetical protein VP01_237g8 [Puccinia sorghi]
MALDTITQKLLKAHSAFTGQNCTYFNSTMMWLQGKALVTDGTQDLLCEFEGYPNLIERCFGGNFPWHGVHVPAQAAKEMPDPQPRFVAESPVDCFKEGPDGNTCLRASSRMHG